MEKKTYQESSDDDFMQLSDGNT